NFCSAAPSACASGQARRLSWRRLAAINEGEAPSRQPAGGWRYERLFHFDDSASLGKLLLDGLGFVLGNAFFDVLRRSIHQFLGFLQAQAGDLADGLDYIDLF